MVKPKLSDELCDVLRKLTARKRDDRWPSMANLAETLRSIPAKRPSMTRESTVMRPTSRGRSCEPVTSGRVARMTRGWFAWSWIVGASSNSGLGLDQGADRLLPGPCRSPGSGGRPASSSGTACSISRATTARPSAPPSRARCGS